MCIRDRLELLNDLTEESDSAEADEQKELIKERLGKLPLAKLSADDFGSGKFCKRKLAESFLRCV